MAVDDLLRNAGFPRSSTYDPDWILSAVSGGANSLWLTEWLAEDLPLSRGMRVLDLGCGRGASSVFLHREFGVQVWATDLWFPVDDRARRIEHADLGDAVFPLHADARALPFAAAFFDAVVSIDAFPYFGTDDLYLGYLCRFLRPGGLIAMAGAGLTHELDDGVPEHLRAWWEPDLCSLHDASWWSRHWQRSGVVDVLLADTMPDGHLRWLDWQRTAAPDNDVEIDAVSADGGRHLGYVRAIARRRAGVTPAEPITAIAVDHTPHRLLRRE